MLSYKTPIKQRIHCTANRELQLLHVGVKAHSCMENRLFRFIYSRTMTNVMKNVSPWQNQGCTIWPWNQTATCTACLHHITVQEAFQGTCTDQFASAHPPDRKPGWFWWTQQTVHISHVGAQVQMSDKLLSWCSWMQHWDQPEEAAKILAAAGGPEEDTVVSSQSWRHNVAFCLATRVPLTIMNHPKTAEKNRTMARPFH